ncbi:MAG: hypothetical protein Q8J96_03815 [Rhodocyclaceae bacterium]|nr:hypothetical protein [Rhodocyclaceae bacterium]
MRAPLNLLLSSTQIDTTCIRLDFTQVVALLASRHASDAKAASTESRRWRDGVKDDKEAANDGRWRLVA